MCGCGHQVAAADQGLRSLSRCDELRHAYLESMSRDWPSFAAAADHLPSGPRDNCASSFTRAVFRRLPALLDCGDDVVCRLCLSCVL